MTSEFKLEIIRPTSKQVEIVEWVDVQTPNGNFVVGPKHTFLVSLVKERSKFIYKKVESLKTDSFDVYGGFFKVNNNHAVIILDI